MSKTPLAWLSVASVLLGCRDRSRPGPSTDPESVGPSAVAAALGLDAGALGDPSDPPPPAGDLRSDLDRFVNVPTCVKERSNLDPLVGDGLRAIGYDTFLRDACRLLEAAKDKKRDACDRIDASSMRAKCQSWVAMVSETPDACPLQFDHAPARGRPSSCLAVASKDARLCEGEGDLATRKTCEALTLRDERRCDALAPDSRPRCKREFTRWRSLLAPPLSGLAALPSVRGKLILKSESTDAKATETDLTAELARGGVVVAARERAYVELGLLGETDGSRIAPSPNRRPRIGLAVRLEPGGTSNDAPKTVLERLELDVPGEATIVSPAARCDCLFTTSRVDRARGGEIALAMHGAIGAGSRQYRIDVDVVTFVRDVVAETATSGRVLPPVHPNVQGGAGPRGLR